MPIETEIKFRVANLAALAEQLQSAGFRLETPRSFESNVLYDTPDRQMRARTEILRIRSYAGRWTLTHKGLPGSGVAPRGNGRSSPLGQGSNTDEDRHKHRLETETGIVNGEALAEFFLGLGLIAAFRYEKWRTEWTDGEGHCVIDETPIGDYAELEGSSAWIDRTATRIGVDPSQYVTLSYGRLFEAWCEEHSSPAHDLTFAAVAQAPVANH